MKHLSAYLHDKEVGRFTEDSGAITFEYADRMAAGAEETCQLSVSIPVAGPSLQQAPHAFVAGLLPDSARHRQILARGLSLADPADELGLLALIGRDCAGAVTFRTPGLSAADAGSPGILWMDEPTLACRLASLPDHPLLIDKVSGNWSTLAGFNEKVAVVAAKNRIGLPVNGEPSTHIIKTDIPGLQDSVRVEHFCLLLAKSCGQDVVQSEIKIADGHSFMLMKRYDRRAVAGSDGFQIRRLHQEDFCQAMGRLPSQKQERRGGPTWKDCFDLLSVTKNPVADRLQLLDRAILQYLIGNPDAHGKNYALLYNHTGAIALAPLYDINNAAAFRSNFKRAKQIMAMSIGGNFDSGGLTTENWKQFAEDCGLSPALVMHRLEHLAAMISAKVIEVRDAVRETVAETLLLDSVVTDISNRAGLWFDKGMSPRP